MKSFESFRERLAQINEITFDELALEAFRFQATSNAVYARYLGHLGLDIGTVNHWLQIPFLPIRFFKSHQVQSGDWVPQTVYRSSGTTQTGHSRHAIDDVSFYLRHATQIFQSVLHALSGAHLIAVLPGYTERPDSSLVAMVDHFINLTGSPHSGFCLHDCDALRQRLASAREAGGPVVLWGVTFALLDLIENGVDLSGVVVMETGGMKGRRKEIIRAELHELLMKAGPTGVCSEYGMTELLSQAYSFNGSVFHPPPAMRVVFREANDPFRWTNGHGVINVVDLANIHSCCFIETEDLGRAADNGFEVLGRLDQSDLRGCNLMVS